MKYCKRCLQPDTNPVVKLDSEQICGRCRYEEEKKYIDWDKRYSQLKQITNEAKQKAIENGTVYDCIIGVSGGKDSTFQAVYAKEVLGLHPLLVNGAPDLITEVGRYNLDNLNKLGFDIISIRPDPNVIKHLTKKLFFERGNLAAGSEYSLVASTYIIADKFNIPLIIQGENAVLTLGNAAKNMDASDNAYNMIHMDTLKGKNGYDLCDDIVKKEQLYFHQYPDPQTMANKGIRAIWLQYYLKEWSFVGNADFAIARGLKGWSDDLHDIGCYRPYSSMDSDLVIPNRMIKWLKFGYGLATDQACCDICEGRLSRESAIWYVKEYDGKCGQKYIDSTCKYLDITEVEFWDTVDKFVNKDLFDKGNKMGQYIPKFEVGVDMPVSEKSGGV